jgi:hypothetical protein
MTAETLQVLLVLSGWLVAFLLGRELGTGYQQWRASRNNKQGL